MTRFFRKAPPPQSSGLDEAAKAALDDACAIPERDRQLEILCDLIPPTTGDSRIVDVGCGAGRLSALLLRRFRKAHVLGLDDDQVCLDRARHDLAHYGDRFEARAVDLRDPGWRRFPWPVHAFVSFHALRRLRHADKQRLISELAVALVPGGAFVVADLCLPVSPASARLAARAWDQAARDTSQAKGGDLRAYNRFRAERRNLFSAPNPALRLAPLLRQLKWLEAAGLEHVDVYWSRAGHAVFGGAKHAK